MNVVRQIYDNLPETIKAPKSLKNRRVEVIMLTLDEEIESQKADGPKKDCQIDDFIGAWTGEPLVRPDQGEFEDREPLK